MNRRQAALVVVALVASLALAFPLREAVEQMVVVPLAFVWWLLRFVYSVIPQQFLWTGLLFLIAYVALEIFLAAPLREGRHRPVERAARGPVENLAHWIENGDNGIYFKWSLARLVGRIALQVQELRDHRAAKNLSWGREGPSQAVQAYLQAGLNSSFADYPLPGRFRPPAKTPFDIDLNVVVEYLESQMEKQDDRNRR